MKALKAEEEGGGDGKKKENGKKEEGGTTKEEEGGGGKEKEAGGGGKLIEKEGVGRGSVGWKVYRAYIRCAGGLTVFFLAVLSLWTGQGVYKD